MIVSLLGASGAFARTWKVVFNYDGGSGGFNGSPQSWTVPPRVYRATFHVYGAQGQRGENGGAAGGLGGEAIATFAVHPGEVLQITVGGMPAGFIAFAGYNGGAVGDGYGPSYWGGGGGGASDVRTAPYHLSDRVLIGGGGGGGGGPGNSSGEDYSPPASGGAGGGRTGGSGEGFGCEDFGSASLSAGGGSQTRGGYAADCSDGRPVGRNGALGVGGAGSLSASDDPSIAGGGGGGGGGLYGGGGGGTGVTCGGFALDCNPQEGEGGTGGGGGSGFGPSGVVFHNGVRRGNGRVVISYTQNCSAGAKCIKALGAPTHAIATSGHHDATVSFVPPREGNGILYFTVRSTSGHHTATGKRSPITVKGLTDGEAYSFTVTATNEIGTGPPSNRSNSVTPSAVPGAPTGVDAVGGDTVAVVGFTPPREPYAPIQSYTVTASPGGRTAVGTTSPITVTGLTNGTAYTFTVIATNAIGKGPRSAAAFATPVGPPGTPTNAVAAAGTGTASVSFVPPPTGGEPITKYTVTASPGGATATGTAAPITVTGLTSGTTYTFTVTATNELGTGPASAPSNAVIPVGPPGAPTAATATKAGATSATVAFTAPTSDGGAPITKYTVTASPGGTTATGTASPITVTGLTSGTTYTFTVTATNAVGTGPPSAPSNAVTPVGPPGAPTGATASNLGAGAQVAFTAPTSDGGSPITGYTVTATSSNGGVTVTVSGKQSPIDVKGLTGGKKYTFTVTATNAVGTGPPSAPSNAITTT